MPLPSEWTWSPNSRRKLLHYSSAEHSLWISSLCASSQFSQLQSMTFKQSELEKDVRSSAPASAAYPPCLGSTRKAEPLSSLLLLWWWCYAVCWESPCGGAADPCCYVVRRHWTLLPHILDRERVNLFMSCATAGHRALLWQAWDISHHWQGWVHKLWEVLLIQYWRAADILYFCPVILQLLLLQSQHCSYLTAVLTGSIFLSMYRKGSACWPSCYSSTGAHCYATIQWHVQPVHEESCDATLHRAILAWTKSTVPVSWANSARKRAEEGKSLENYNLQGQVQTLCSHLLLESWNTAMPKTLTHGCNFCFSVKGGGSGTITLPTTGKASPTSKAN